MEPTDRSHFVRRSSRYIPVVNAATWTDSKNGNKSARSSSILNATKRRSTMNSRDAAYDEEELLRRAIEESKAEGITGGSVTSGEKGSSGRRGKRGRSESEE